MGACPESRTALTQAAFDLSQSRQARGLGA